MEHQNTKKQKTVILHVDMDAFFASIEQRDNPALRGRPVIVGAKPGSRGVVSAASYEARTFGVRSALPISRAVELCPHGAFVLPRMEVYCRVSHDIMKILEEFSPIVEQRSVDEAYLDITGTEKLLGVPSKVAKKIQVRIMQSTGLTISVGIAPNKFLSKIASDMNKPNGITMTPFDEKEIITWLAPMPCGRIFGVGKVTEAVFLRLGIKTIGDVQKLSQQFLVQKFGEQGKSLYNLCRGIDTNPLHEYENAKSISREHTFQENTADSVLLKATLLTLSREVTRQARQDKTKGSTIVFVYRGADFTKHTRRVTLSTPTNLSQVMYKTVCDLYEKSPIHGCLVRLIGVGLTGFSDSMQIDMFENTDSMVMQEASEKAVDIVTLRFGKNAIFLGGEKIKKKDNEKKN